MFERMQILAEQEAAEVVADDVTVTKSVLDLGRENVAGIKLTVRTSSTERVAVEVVEEFPGHVSMGDVQVHPDYAPEKWTISEQLHRMTFEDEIPPEGEVETLYGVRVNHEEELEPFLDDPHLVRARPVSAESAPAGGDHGAAVAKAGRRPRGTAGSGESNADSDHRTEPEGVTDAESAGGDHSSVPTGVDTIDVESLSRMVDSVGDYPASGMDSEEDGTNAASPVDSGSQSAFDPEPTPGTDAPSSGRSSMDPESPTVDVGSEGPFVFGEGRSEASNRVRNGSTRDGDATASSRHGGAMDRAATAEAVRALIEAGTRGTLSDEQRARLRTALDLKPSDQLQLTRLQTSMARVSAFADEFDEFVDAVGPPAAALEELRAALDRLAGSVDELSTSSRDAAGEREALRDRIDQLERGIGSLREDHSSSVEQLTARVEELEAVLEAEAFGPIREIVAAERRWRQLHDDVRSRDVPLGPSGSVD